MNDEVMAKRAIHAYAAMAVELDDIARALKAEGNRPIGYRHAVNCARIARRACRAEQLALQAREKA